MDFQTLLTTFIYYLTRTGVVLGTLSILVIIHEWGHFIVARMSGVRVLEFSFGMGKLLFSKRWGDTDYQFRIFPMGGFIKMAGEEDDTRESEPKPDEFYGVSPWRRLGIVFAGPLMNWILALGLFWGVILLQGEQFRKPVIGHLSQDSIAYRSGLRSGDIIQDIQGVGIENYGEVEDILSRASETKTNLKVKRGDELLSVEVTPELKWGRDLLGDSVRYGDIGLHYYSKALIGSILSGMPAEKAGLLPGDRIVAIDGQEIFFWEELLAVIRNSPGKTLSLEWEREGQRMSSEIVPKAKILPKSSEEEQEEAIGEIGVMLQLDSDLLFYKQASVFQAFSRALDRIVRNMSLTYRALKKMLFGNISRDNLMGPVRLAGMVSDVAKNGVMPWLMFLGFISLQLAIFNLLPLPALDGGHFLFFSIEILLRRSLNMKILDWINRIGFVLLISLFVFVTANDLSQMFAS